MAQLFSNCLFLGTTPYFISPTFNVLYTLACPSLNELNYKKINPYELLLVSIVINGKIKLLLRNVSSRLKHLLS